MAASARPRRGWAGHRLVEEWARTVVKDADVRPGEFVLDLGAGDGALTAELVARGARVLAVELHPGRVRHLRQRFMAADVTVVQFDLSEFRPPRQPFRVVANPPYSMSTAIVRSLLGPRSGIVAADLVLQRALMRRLSEARAPGGQRWLREFDIQRGRSLPRAAFDPRPHVDSAVLVIRRRGGLPRHDR